MEIKTYKIQNYTIKIYLDKRVFTPSNTTIHLAEKMKVNPGETVCDIGTGCGLLAILASKMGAKEVYATDINAEGIVIAKKSAELNGVKINFASGNMFGPFNKKKFDVIVSNMPQTPVPVPEGLSNETLRDISGGRDGSELVIRFIKLSSKRLKPNGRLYVPVAGMSNPKKTMKELRKYFTYTKIASYKAWLSEGEIKGGVLELKTAEVHREDKKYYCIENIYCAKLKK